ncbi:hypothetical protein [Sphingomonas sp. MMS24-J13]|uniref:hypothetical protein n=1 Tax=Sphingomonas sp. MMS24-J13 TaxID=3238686 RepID=UPI00384B714F
MTVQPLTGRAMVKAAILSLGTVWVAYLAFVSAVVNVTHIENPSLALQFAPHDPAALDVQAGLMLVKNGGDLVGSDETAAMARDSLRHQVLNPVALRLLGLSTRRASSFATGRAVMALAERMTRRDLITELWLIQEAVLRGDVQSALSHYDYALRTWEASQDLLLPILVTALKDEPVRVALIPYVREPAPWLLDFTRAAVGSSKQPSWVADTYLRAGGMPADPIYDTMRSGLLGKLAEAREFAWMIRYYESLPEADSKVLRTVAMTPASTDTRFPPATWGFYSVPGGDSSFVRSSQGNSIELHTALEPSVISPVAFKAMLTPPGLYRFRADQQIVAPSEGATGNWEVRCANLSGRVLWSGSAPLGVQRRRIEGTFAVPDDCQMVMLRAIVASGDARDGVEAILSNASMTPSP